MKPFWILWHPNGQTPPKVRFENLASAKKEAERLMRSITTGTMFIMKSVGGVEIQTTVLYVKPISNKRK